MKYKPGTWSVVENKENKILYDVVIHTDHKTHARRVLNQKEIKCQSEHFPVPIGHRRKRLKEKKIMASISILPENWGTCGNGMKK